MSKKICAVFALWILLIIVSISNSSALPLDNALRNLEILRFPSNKKDYQVIELKSNNSTFPTSLTAIEESAFEGTALTDVRLPETVEIIGDYAFANIEKLEKINIPDKTTILGNEIFKGSNKTTITGSPKGYARTWAKENGIPYVPIVSFYAFNTSVQIICPSRNQIEQRTLIKRGRTNENKIQKPTGRMTEELNADKYKGLITFHIQGRSPPKC